MLHEYSNSDHYEGERFGLLLQPTVCACPVVCVSVCLSVCVFVSVREHISETTGRYSPVLYVSPTAVARFSSGGVAIRYAFPVLWVT